MELTKIASVYIVVITIAFIVIFYALMRQRKIMHKNKCKYDLRTVRFEIEPISDESWRLNFYSGKLLHSEIVTKADVTNDRGYYYKSFVKWLEEESDETKG